MTNKKFRGKGIDWDSPSIDWGKPDGQIAAEMGVTRTSARAARHARGIPSAFTRRRPIVRHWTIHDTKRLDAIRATYCAAGNFGATL